MMQAQLEPTGTGIDNRVGERPLPGTFGNKPAVPEATRSRGEPSTAHFLRHSVEMAVGMMLGMAVLGAVSQTAVAAAGLDYERAAIERPEVSALVMAFNMTLPMVWWMRHRGHSWSYITEMAAAMFIPVVALTPPLWLGFISGEALSGIQHVIMIPSMLVVMLRRRSELAG